MGAKKKVAVNPLKVCVHAKRMNWDSNCVFITANFGTTFDGYLGESFQTKLGRIRVKDLGFVLIVEKGREPPRAPMDGLEYRDVSSVSQYDAKEMAKSLEMVDRAMRKLYERFGSAESLRAWFRRVCDVLGVEMVEFSREMADFVGMPKHSRDNDGRCVLYAETADHWLQKAVEMYAASDEQKTETVAS